MSTLVVLFKNILKLNIVTMSWLKTQMILPDTWNEYLSSVSTITSYINAMHCGHLHDNYDSKYIGQYAMYWNIITGKTG